MIRNHWILSISHLHSSAGAPGGCSECCLDQADTCPSSLCHHCLQRMTLKSGSGRILQLGKLYNSLGSPCPRSWALLVVVSPGWGKGRGSFGWHPSLNTVSALWAFSYEFFFSLLVNEMANTSWLWYNRNCFHDAACECPISHLSSLENPPHLPGLYLIPTWFPDLKKSPCSQSQLRPYSHIQLLTGNQFYLPWKILQQPQELCLKNQ